MSWVESATFTFAKSQHVNVVLLVLLLFGYVCRMGGTLHRIAVVMYMAFTICTSQQSTFFITIHFNRVGSSLTALTVRDARQ